MAKTPDPTTLFNIRGRWGVEDPFNCPPDQVIDAVNVDWFNSSVGRRRPGSKYIFTETTNESIFGEEIAAMFSHVPGEDFTARELWAIDNATADVWGRLAGGTAWAQITPGDGISNNNFQVNAVTFNGKLWFAYDSTVNRMHVWDGTSHRRAGMATAGVPSVANTGAGAYAATIRYYKVVYATLSGSTFIRRGEASAAVSFTPSGAGTAARVTKPAAASEGETHWLLYASPDNSNYVLIATTVVGTTTYDDSATPSLYSGTAIPVAGTFTNAPSYKYLATDDARLIGAGANETTAGDAMAPSNRRVWWSGASGATDQGDDERVSNTSTIKNYLDVDQPVTGLGGPLNGVIHIFSRESQWRMVSTGVAVAPYLRYRVSGGRGCIEHKSIVVAEDEFGEPALYWASTDGPYRQASGGQQSLIEDVRDYWTEIELGVSWIVAHSVWHQTKKQVWMWIAQDGAATPNVKLMFDVRKGRVTRGAEVRGGWAIHTIAAACSCMMSSTLGASMSIDVKPYISQGTVAAVIIRCDEEDQTQDNVGLIAADYDAYILTRPYTPWGLGNVGGSLEEPTILMKNLAAATWAIKMTTIPDFNTSRQREAEIAITSADYGDRISEEFDGVDMADAWAVQYKVGDPDDSGDIAAWNIDAVTVPAVNMGPNK